MALRTRKPTGKMAPPVVLVEGDEGAGKSWAAAELSASDKVGRTVWLQVGEVTADEYGQIPGVRYEIAEHDGTWRQIYGVVLDAKEEADHARKRGDKPMVLVIDTVGAIWELLSEWAYNRAKSTESNRKKLARDANAEIDITANFWNDANARWRKLMTAVLTFPGIVVLLSRGRETALIGPDGKPVARQKDYRVDGQKNLAFDVPAWVRMTRGGVPQLIKLRSVRNGIQPGERPQPLPGFTLEKFIFERLGYDPRTAEDRQVVPLAAGSDAPLSDAAAVIELAINAAEDTPQLRQAHAKVKPALDKGDITEAESEYLYALVQRRKPQMPNAQEQAPANGRAAQVAQADDYGPPPASTYPGPGPGRPQGEQAAAELDRAAA